MTRTQKVTVRVNFTIDVDLEAWALEYGIEATPAAVRRDVKQHVEQTALGQFAALEVLAS